MKICALCGDMIFKQDETVEHVPPKLFYPKSLRPTIVKQFWTVPSHRVCNERSRMDEEYFYYFLMPLVVNENSEISKALIDDLRERRKNPQTTSMIKWLLSEMKTETPSGIILPPSIRRFSVNQVRVQNVALKIAQCIYFKEHGKFLPQLLCKHCELVERIEYLQPLYRLILEHTEPVSIAPDLFNYRYICVDGVHHFGFMFWASYMFCLAFDDPDGKKDFIWMRPQ
ncbi:MAG: hypothetical protein JW808_08365 [Victivallales bacterium]|nr:hypothetical protein [Victivallales bacterium]